MCGWGGGDGELSTCGGLGDSGTLFQRGQRVWFTE